MRAAHPDAAGSDVDPATAARRTALAARLNVARDWLTDPVRRGRYDEVRFGGFGRSVGSRSVPAIDPLGDWPDRPPRPTGPGPGVFAAIGLMAVLYSLVVGIGANILSAAAFVMGSILIVFYGLLAVLGLFRSR